MGQDSLVESGSVPGGIFGSHKQKVSPTGDAFSYFLSGRQETALTFLKLHLRRPAAQEAQDVIRELDDEKANALLGAVKQSRDEALKLARLLLLVEL